MRTLLVGIAIGVAVVVLRPAIVQQATSGVGAMASARPSGSAAPRTSGGVAAQISAVDRALAQARLSGTTVPVTLTFTEADLVASAAPYFPQTVSGITLSDPAVHLGSAQITLDVSAQAAFVKSRATVVATASVVDGRPATTIVSATIGGAPLPQSVTGGVKTQLDQALAAGLPAKFGVTTITIGSGILTVTGVANP